MFFESWTSVGRVVLTGVLAYAALVAVLRVSGKRTLSKMNAFDLVVTVALGSVFATVLTSREVPLADGVAALATLVALQYLVAWGASRSSRFGAVLKSRPRVLFHRGVFSRAAMREERVAEDEIRAAIRAASVPGIEEVESVVLESSGEISVVRRRPPEPRRGTPGGVRPGAERGRLAPRVDADAART